MRSAATKPHDNANGPPLASLPTLGLRALSAGLPASTIRQPLSTGIRIPRDAVGRASRREANIIGETEANARRTASSVGRHAIPTVLLIALLVVLPAAAQTDAARDAAVATVQRFIAANETKDLELIVSTFTDARRSSFRANLRRVSPARRTSDVSLRDSSNSARA